MSGDETSRLWHAAEFSDRLEEAIRSSEVRIAGLSRQIDELKRERSAERVELSELKRLRPRKRRASQPNPGTATE